MLKKIFFSVLILLAPALLLAQNSSTLKAARKEYQALKYAPAIALLEKELKYNPGEIEAEEMLADSYRKTKNYEKAVFWYSKLTTTNPIKPAWALYYAEALANKEEYEASEQWYNKYLALEGHDDKRASSFAGIYPGVDVFFKDRKEWKLSYLNINTAASEYSPIYYKNGLIFTSNRKFRGIVKRVFEWDQSPFTDLYYVDDLNDIKPVNTDSLSRVLRKNYDTKGEKLYRGKLDDLAPTTNDSKILGTYNMKLLRDTLGNYLSEHMKIEPVQGKVNTKYNEGSAALLPDGSIIFTRNNYNDGKYGKSKEGINKLKMYIAKAPDWETIESFAYNSDEYSVEHPAVNTAGTLLIFASDMPGGMGGQDLYYCKRAGINDPWGKPVNMGPVINTEGNEVFPAIYRDSILYFSSTGHVGLGGLDIFQVVLDGVTPLHKPVNLGAPVNSSTDDFDIIRNSDGTMGYFSSNRRGSDDIYSFVYRPFQIRLKGTVIDSLSSQPVLNSVVTINPQITLQAGTTGNFTAVLQRDIVYHITAKTDGYNTVSGTVSTGNIMSDTTLNIVLKPRKKIIPPIIIPFNCDSARQALTLNNIYYDFNKWFIRTDASKSLDGLIDILKTHPDLHITAASYCDSRGTENYNVTLSMHRAESVQRYLVDHGIDSQRIQITYFGENNLVNNCLNGAPCSEAEQQLNRRTEFYLTKDGKKVLNMECDPLKQALSGK